MRSYANYETISQNLGRLGLSRGRCRGIFQLEPVVQITRKQYKAIGLLGCNSCGLQVPPGGPVAQVEIYVMSKAGKITTAIDGGAE